MQVLAFLSQDRQLYQKTEILSLEKVKKNSYCPHVAVHFNNCVNNWHAETAYVEYVNVVDCITIVWVANSFVNC